MACLETDKRGGAGESTDVSSKVHILLRAYNTKSVFDKIRDLFDADKDKEGIIGSITIVINTSKDEINTHDQIVELAAEYPGKLYAIPLTDAEHGWSKALNKGIKHIISVSKPEDHIFPLSNEAEADVELIDKLAKVLDANPKVPAVFPKFEMHDWTYYGLGYVFPRNTCMMWRASFLAKDPRHYIYEEFIQHIRGNLSADDFSKLRFSNSSPPPGGEEAESIQHFLEALDKKGGMEDAFRILDSIFEFERLKRYFDGLLDEHGLDVDFTPLNPIPICTGDSVRVGARVKDPENLTDDEIEKLKQKGINETRTLLDMLEQFSLDVVKTLARHTGHHFDFKGKNRLPDLPATLNEYIAEKESALRLVPASASVLVRAPSASFSFMPAFTTEFFASGSGQSMYRRVLSLAVLAQGSRLLNSSRSSGSLCLTTRSGSAPPVFRTASPLGDEASDFEDLTPRPKTPTVLFDGLFRGTCAERRASLVSMASTVGALSISRPSTGDSRSDDFNTGSTEITRNTARYSADGHRHAWNVVMVSSASPAGGSPEKPEVEKEEGLRL